MVLPFYNKKTRSICFRKFCCNWNAWEIT